MKVQYSRPATGGFGSKGTEVMVSELPDIDPSTNEPMAVPDGAVKVDDSVPVHDWQRVMPGMPAGAQ